MAVTLLRDCDICSVAMDTDDSCQHDQPVQLITESGLISGSALLDSGRCIWQVSVGRGQRVRLRPDVFRPGSKSLVLGESPPGSVVKSEADNCPWLLTIEGDEKAARVPLCARTNSRRRSVECKPRGSEQACSVFLDWPDGFTDEDRPVFIVHYEGINVRIVPDPEIVGGDVVEPRAERGWDVGRGYPLPTGRGL